MKGRSIYTLPEDDIAYEDLVGFVDQHQESGKDERVTWEFKDKVSAEALSDTLIAFANTFGGVLVIGVRQRKDPAQPWQVVGVDGKDRDVNRLYNIIGQHIRPLVHVDIVERALPNDNSRALIMCRVDQSDLAPHEDIIRRRILVREGDSIKGMDLRTIESLLRRRRSPEEEEYEVPLWGIDRSKPRVIFVFQPNSARGPRRLYDEFGQRLRKWISDVVRYDVDPPKTVGGCFVFEWLFSGLESTNRLFHPDGKLKVDEGLGMRFCADWGAAIHVYCALHYLQGWLDVYSRVLWEFKQFPHFGLHTDWNLNINAEGSSPLTSALWPEGPNDLVSRIARNAASLDSGKGYFQHYIPSVSPHEAGEETGRRRIVEELLYQLARHCGVAPRQGELERAAGAASRPPGWNRASR